MAERSIDEVQGLLMLAQRGLEKGARLHVYLDGPGWIFAESIDPDPTGRLLSIVHAETESTTLVPLTALAAIRVVASS